MDSRAAVAPRSTVTSLFGDPYLLAILALAIALRLYDLSRESIWLDEAYSLAFSGSTFGEIFFQRQDSPPLYYLVLHVWVPLAGTSETALRLPSVVCGIASVAALYLLARRLFDVNTARLAALLIASSVFHVQFAQEARTYTLTVLLTILSMQCYLNLLDRFERGRVVAYLIVTTLLLYSHVYALFTIAAQNAYFMIAHFLSLQPARGRLRNWVFLQLALLAMFAPWVPNLAAKVMDVRQGFWVAPVRIGDIYSSMITYASGSRCLLLLFLVLAASALVSVRRVPGVGLRPPSFASIKAAEWRLTIPDADRSCFLLLWLLAPIVLPFALSQLSQSIYVTRYTIAASLPFFLLVANGIEGMRSPVVRAAVISLVVASASLQLYNYYTTFKKEEWREAAAYVDGAAGDNDLILFNANDAILPFNYYSRSGGALTKIGVSKVDDTNIELLMKTVERADRIWVVLSHHGSNQALISSRLEAVFSRAAHKGFHDIDIDLYERRH